MKRGRKQDNTLPPSRSREIQRAFRQRRTDYIRGLELRIIQLEAEVDDVLARHGETPRYSTPEVAAARSASRKKQKIKSKHNLAQFMDVSELGEPASPHSPACLPLASVALSSPISSNHDVKTELSGPARYMIRDMTGVFSTGPHSPQHSKASSPPQGHPGNGHDEYDSRDVNSSILSRRSKPLLQLWNAPIKSNDSLLSSHSSSTSTSSQVSLPISCNPHDNSHSQLEMFMDMDPVIPSSDVSSQLISSLAFRPISRVAPPSCSLSSLLAEPFSQHDPLSSVPFNSYHSNQSVNSPSFNYQSSQSQLSDGLSSCSYSFLDPSNNSGSNFPGYHQDTHLSVLRSRSCMSDQTNLKPRSLSTLIAIAATRLDHCAPQQSNCGYQTSNLQSNLVEPCMPSDSLEKLDKSQMKNVNLGQDEYSKSTRTDTPSSSSSSEPKDSDPSVRLELLSQSDEKNAFDEFSDDYNSSCVPFYRQSTTHISRDKEVTRFATEMFQIVNVSEMSR